MAYWKLSSYELLPYLAGAVIRLHEPVVCGVGA